MSGEEKLAFEQRSKARFSKGVCTVVAILGLPPGGGKSSFFASLRETALDAAVASSDEQNAIGGHFDKVLGCLVRGGAALIGYDKNIPNVAGLEKMIRVLASLEKQQHVSMRVVLVVPRSLRLKVPWERVRNRPPTDIALNIHTVRGGEAAAFRIFKSTFYDECEAFLPLAQRLAAQLPGCAITDAFWESHQAARRVAASVLGLAPRALSLEALLIGMRGAIAELESEREASNAACAAASDAARKGRKGPKAMREPPERMEERKGPKATASRRDWSRTREPSSSLAVTPQPAALRTAGPEEAEREWAKERNSSDRGRAESVQVCPSATSATVAAAQLPVPAVAGEASALAAAPVAAAAAAQLAAATSAALEGLQTGRSARGQSLVAVVHQMTGRPKQAIVAACFRLDLPVFGWDEKTAPSLLIQELERSEQAQTRG